MVIFVRFMLVTEMAGLGRAIRGSAAVVVAGHVMLWSQMIKLRVQVHQKHKKNSTRTAQERAFACKTIKQLHSLRDALCKPPTSFLSPAFPALPAFPAAASAASLPNTAVERP